ncbi:MAG: hypothetical protein RLZZ312_833 [Bacteroidota bacterium]|jgi:glycosyltransferase involved in cell wall biosynthesis
MLSILFYFFIGVITIQFGYYILVFGRFSFSKKNQKSVKKEIPISVIVCAKNEQENVVKYIPLLAEQQYTNFEIVLIDDASRDDTLEVFEEFEKKYNNIKLVKVENNEAFWGNKKFALTLGIKAATKPNLLFIDADCYPISKDWITEMSQCFDDEKTIILGYGAYEKIDNSFLNKLIRFETLLTATQYFSWAKIGRPYMGIGRNLGYKTAEFYAANGFINHMKIRSGDDDLFINSVSNKANTAICSDMDSFTYSVPKTTFLEWFAQKRRHVSTARYYKFFDKFQLSIFFITQIAFVLLSTILLIYQFEWQIVIGVIGFRYFFTWLSLGFSASKLQEKDVMYYYPFLEIILICTQLNVFFTNMFSKPVHWR